MTRFDEQALRRDIVATWGATGEHVDLFDWLVSSRQILADQKATLIAEIERLRALITAWADADDALVALFGTNAAWDKVNAAEKRSDEALDALRKAVGR